MTGKNSRRKFFKQLAAISTFSAASVLSIKKEVKNKVIGLGATDANAMDNPEYDSPLSANELRIEYRGMSCFVITASNGTKIITDPFIADNQILYPELRKEPADVVTVSCGNYAHCYVWDVGGMPYIYKKTEPAKINGITFRGVSTRHLEMKEVGPTRPDENIVICFEADGIKVCHLGALGHKLSDEQVRQIGKVDILMAPVNGVSALPLTDANEVCNQLNPRVIIPMHYRSNRSLFPSWAAVDEFLKLRGKAGAGPGRAGSGLIFFKAADLPSETQVVVPGYPT
jgi:L-ascorbate metabolism protein UlaG (beta-lactamase superfamily)